MFTKEQEFNTWLLEERMINPESTSRPALKKLFQAYMEDYNTATLPHEKYYALEAYERRMAAIRDGDLQPAGDEDTYDVTKDLAAHKAGTTRRSDKESDTYLSRDQLQELQRVQRERAQIGKMKMLGLQVKGSMGVRMDGNQFE